MAVLPHVYMCARARARAAGGSERCFNNNHNNNKEYERGSEWLGTNVSGRETNSSDEVPTTT